MTDLVNSDTFYYLCRLCALKCSTPGVEIFSEEGMWRDVPKKIRDCLHFNVSISIGFCLFFRTFTNCFIYYRLTKVINILNIYVQIVHINLICIMNFLSSA